MSGACLSYGAKNRAAPPGRQVHFGCAHDVYEEHGRVLHGLGKARKQERTLPPLNSVRSTVLNDASLHPVFRPAPNQRVQATSLCLCAASANSNVVAILDRLLAGSALREMSFDDRIRGRGDPRPRRWLRDCKKTRCCPVVFAIFHRRTVAASGADAAVSDHHDRRHPCPFFACLRFSEA